MNSSMLDGIAQKIREEEDEKFLNAAFSEALKQSGMKKRNEILKMAYDRSPMGLLRKASRRFKTEVRKRRIKRGVWESALGADDSPQFSGIGVDISSGKSISKQMLVRYKNDE